MLNQEIERLNKELSEIKTSRVRIIWYMKNDGVLALEDIAEFSLPVISTPKTKVLSKAGIEFLMERYDTEMLTLVTLENASS